MLTEMIVPHEGSFFHGAVFITKKNLYMVSRVQIVPDNSSRFSFTFEKRWFAPPDTALLDTVHFKLQGKTKKGVFRYVQVDG